MVLPAPFALICKGIVGGGVDDGAEAEKEGNAASPTPSPFANLGLSDDDAIVAMDVDVDDVPRVGPHTPNA